MQKVEGWNRKTFNFLIQLNSVDGALSPHLLFD